MAGNFSLKRFEALCYSHLNEEAANEFFNLLSMLDKNYGSFDDGFEATPTSNFIKQNLDEHLVNRICSALSALFSDPSFNLSIEGERRLFILHRWIASLFAVSSFKNADHILRALSKQQEKQNDSAASAGQPDQTSDDLTIAEKDLVKFCILYTPHSLIPLNLDQIWEYNKKYAIELACALISPRLLGSEAAHYKREVLLEWLPDKLDQIDELDFLPTPILHDVYMHCSYADTKQRHKIRKSINRLIKIKLNRIGFSDVDLEEEALVKLRSERTKPILFVPLEWFTKSHSIYRTHSASLFAAKEKFELIGVASNKLVDETSKAIFDQFYFVEDQDSLKSIYDLAIKLKPDVIYYPSCGMFLHTVMLTTLRLAPVQVISYGHPATTNSKEIDYFVCPKDWVGNPDCFSEKILALEPEDMPFVVSGSFEKVTASITENPKVVNIAVASTSMKINPAFLKALQQIENKSQKPVRFHFLMGMSRGLIHIELVQYIQQYLKNAKVYPYMPYADYIQHLKKCDLYLNPIPFGNTNGIVDTTSVGLVGVCKTGDEVFEHIDEAMFGRLDLPEWLVAKTVDEYIESALRLINEDSLRVELRKALLKGPKEQVFFKGDGSGFSSALLTAYKKTLSQARSKTTEQATVAATTTTKSVKEEKAGASSRLWWTP